MIRLAFSTLACPGWELDEVIRKAREYGYEGVELRGLLDQVDITRRPEFSGRALATTRRKFEDAGLTICCLGSSVHLLRSGREEDGRERAEFERYLAVAAGLGGVPIRLFGGERPRGASEADMIQAAAEELQRLADVAAEADVELLVESHDALLLGRPLSAVLSSCSAGNAGILWDVFNSQIPREESLEETYAYVKPYLRHVHVKDGVPRPKGYSYALFGEGSVAYRDVFRWLLNDGYSGWLSVEWEKRWHPELADPEVALPQYARQMQRLLDELSGGGGEKANSPK